ncbi:hypothetical protein CPB86DRAFT_781105 [Serendipita vermifera]|nr:hypothetical protein CPB86DRAFT_781105 [Serendipita vermifera]
MAATTSSETIDPKTLDAAAALPVWDENGQELTFGSLFKEQKTIVIFIRHFLCGLCQAYVEELGKIPKASLDAAGTRIAVIGCGDWSVVKDYKENINYPYPIYADPTRNLHKKLDLVVNLKGAAAGDKKKSYIPSVAASTINSIMHGLSHITSVMKMGNFAQNGGDFVLGPGLDVVYAHRMKNTQDHAEIEEVMKAAGVAYPVEAQTT